MHSLPPLVSSPSWSLELCAELKGGGGLSSLSLSFSPPSIWPCLVIDSCFSSDPENPGPDQCCIKGSHPSAHGDVREEVIEIRGQWAAQLTSDRVAPLLLAFSSLLLPAPGFIYELSCCFPFPGGWPQAPKASATSGGFFFLEFWPHIY